ncbi:sulfatase family protein [Tautonia plasticadhaerens]|uniref:Choline-sulfatase n=1 Tax=Tautonia plasticadhaerens TaxID=2527974 RepID=A0A518GXD7_9BACT|nr:sulfatase-like hydrolase/transferase [Tautonia plasticadhaerens]QDV33245.1 Choline-sulfatase [Tautonia plasticadhaerens]
MIVPILACWTLAWLPPTDQPDVIVVLADDLGPGDLSGFGGTGFNTPNLDRMAEEGIRFRRYYAASPICSPSRCGILTGQYPGRWRITSFLQTRAGNRACEQADYLDPEAPSLPRILRAAGYATAHVGKWHLGGGRDVDDPPPFSSYGYDLGLGTWESPSPHPDLTARDWIWSAIDPVKRWDRTSWMVDQTLQFLGDHPDRPCFVNLWLDDPHTPWVPSVDDQRIRPGGRASGKGDTPERLRGVMAELDRQVGRLLDALRARESSRPVLVLFLSDNGPLPTFERSRTVGLLGSKLSLFEGGIRVPMIAWGPGFIPAGRTNEDTVLSAIDLLPTLCRLCGAELPPGFEPDGEDLSPALRGELPHRSLPIFWEYGRNDESFAYPRGEHRSPDLAVLDGGWKLLIDDDGSRPLLYDLLLDPTESRDLGPAEPEIRDRLSEMVLDWRRSLP